MNLEEQRLSRAEGRVGEWEASVQSGYRVSVWDDEVLDTDGDG